MKKLIEKHQQSNGRGRGIIQLNPEIWEAYIQSQLNIPGTGTTSNSSVQQANQKARLDEQVKRETPKTRAEGSYRNIEKRRKSGKTKDQEDTERDIKLATQPTWRTEAADAAHYIGTGLSAVGGGLALLSNPVTTGAALVGGIVGGKAVDKASQRLTGKTWAENVQEKLGLQTPTLAEFTNPGYFIGGGLGLKGKGALDYLIKADMPRFGYTPTTQYYFKPGYLGANSSPVGKTLEIPEGYTFIREQMLNGQLKHIVKDPNGKFKVLEDLDLSNVQQQPKVNLRNYHGEKLTGNESGFDEWARTRIPENDHFPDLSHGIKDIRDLLPLMNQEFESLPNGSRIDLGHIFSSDSSSNLLQFIRRNNKRIKVVLPKNYDEMVVTNDHGTRGADSERVFNEQLEKILDLYGYSPDAVPKAVYDPNTNTLSVPKLSFIKLYKKGNRIKWS